MTQLPGKIPATAPRAEERISFFAEQARRRTQATGWSILTGIIGLSMCWSFGFLVVEAVLFYILLFSQFLPRRLERLFNLFLDHAGGLPAVFVAATLFSIALWLFIQRIFARDSSAGLIQRIGARPPNRLDLEEKQLVNVAEEMAIAATVPAPTVMLFDGLEINAAVIGEKPESAVLLVSRELLNQLNRDETQGVIGHLVSSVVNGDLRLIGAMLRAFYMMGLAVTLLDLPFSARSRHAMALLIRHVMQPNADGGTSVGGEQIGEALTLSLQPEGLVAMNMFMQKLIGDEKGVRSWLGALLLFPLLPLIVMRLAAGLIYGLSSLFILGPLVALVLRSRRRLADATAVQLTRNPDGLGAALIHLYGIAHAVPNTGWAEMTFIVGNEAGGARQIDRFQARVTEIKSSVTDFKDRARQTAQAAASLAESVPQEKSEAARHNFIFGFHPSLGSRIVQLQRMGATSIQWVERKDYSGWIVAAVIAFVFGIVLLVALGSQRGSH
ncbi:MAG: M48 family metalloprotease [Opitutus sp.]